MIYAKEKATGKILASNSHCTVESMLSDITSDGTSAEDVVVAEATESEIKTMLDQQHEASKTYADKRRRSYPPIGDQLDALWKGGDEAAAMKVIVDKVKSDNPK